MHTKRVAAHKLVRAIELRHELHVVACSSQCAPITDTQATKQPTLGVPLIDDFNQSVGILDQCERPARERLCPPVPVGLGVQPPTNPRPVDTSCSDIKVLSKDGIGWD